MLSVVIPTYNRCDTLQKAISAYQHQTAIQRITEIIVVDDGSADATRALVAQVADDTAVPIRYFRQENKGPAAARNVGIREAASELILFTDDDIIPSTQLVAEHLEWHERFPDLSTAVLGYVTWAPEVNPTPFMEWYGADGPLFAYAHFAGKSEINYTHFYSCNLSLKTEFLRRNGQFDEDFKIAAYEDCELGYRLKKVGMRLFYNANAIAYHHQHVSFDDACRRAKKGALLGDTVFREKEAGIDYYRGRQARLLSRLKQHLMPWRRPLGWLKLQIAAALLPVKKVMDWKVPLPWTVYRIMFRMYR